MTLTTHTLPRQPLPTNPMVIFQATVSTLLYPFILATFAVIPFPFLVDTQVKQAHQAFRFSPTPGLPASLAFFSPTYIVIGSLGT